MTMITVQEYLEGELLSVGQIKNGLIIETRVRRSDLTKFLHRSSSSQTT